MRFLLLLIAKGSPTGAADPLPDAGRAAAMARYTESLHRSGVLLALDRLHPPAVGARVTYDRGKPRAGETPAGQGGQVLRGYWLLQVKSKADAIEWAKRCPAEDGAAMDVLQVQELAELR